MGSYLAKPGGEGANGTVRALAVQVILQVLSGRSLNDVLAPALAQAPPRDRALLQELCYGVLRWYFRLRGIGGLLLERPLKKKDRDVELLILLGFYQLLYLRIPAHAAVGETVETARAMGKPWAAGLVNGVLRRFQREQEKLLSRVDRDPVAGFAHPDWLLKEIKLRWPDRWQGILQAANARPVMSLRVNLDKIDRQDYVEKLRSAAIPARPIKGVASGLVLDRPQDVQLLPGFSEGLVSVQDGGAQLAAELLELRPGQQVLDACAAPGGKSCHILERESAVALTAVDLDEGRLQRLTENLQRLNLRAEVCVGDAAAPAGEWAERVYDRILLDVPCSATGVIRRHPDIKLLRRPEDIPALAELQLRIVSKVWQLLKPGGILLYATCSLLPQENERQIKHFLAEREDARERPIEATWGHACEYGRQTLPGEDSMDGFYYALLEKV
jgi:16S rRNA (cytosine967-C5)-methyltransferase